ncbi:Ras-related protein Rab-36 [Labeo rohita]|uniref:Ras-related protein Rab-36 n=1 Tax=Labeo rohita TaxID=84645 RepID=A0ABQ8MBF0_LABRO|nr:Ras-related protein Rab-36 [Labeo rohita]
MRRVSTHSAEIRLRYRNIRDVCLSKASFPGQPADKTMHFSPPVSRDRIISTFPKCYNPQACVQMKDDWNTKAKLACQDRTARQQGFCKDAFERDYKATIGVDFEIERFEMSGLPFSLQIWDTAGQEKFKCIASAYYRGAQGKMQVLI